MPTIGKIKAELHGDTRHFDRAMRRSSSRVKGFSSTLQGLRGSLVPITGALGFGGLIRSTVQEADQLAKLSRRLNTSVGDFSRLARVMDRGGIRMSQTGTILQRLQRRAFDASQGNKELTAAFSRLGISLDSFLKLDPVEAFLQTGEALAKLTNTAERIATAFKLFDTEGVAVLNMDLPRLRAEMEKTAAVTERQAKAIEALNDFMTSLGQSMRSLAGQAILDIGEGIPALIELIGRRTGIISPPYEAEPQAPLTGNIIGARPRRPTGIFGGDIGPAQLQGNTFTGGNLAGSNAILEQLRGIRRNTEQRGAVLE